MSKISHWCNLACPWSNTIVLIRIGFTILDLWSFSQGDLLQGCSEQRSCTACHMSLVHLLSLIFKSTKLKSMPFLEHLKEFHLDLCSPGYCRYPQVSYLWIISGRGWNPNVERSYLLEYIESKVEVWKLTSSGFFLRTLRFSSPETSPISGYSECTKT